MDGKFKFDPETLSYKIVKLSAKDKFTKVILPQIFAGIVLAFILFFIASQFIDSTEDRLIKRENELLASQYEQKSERVEQISQVYQDILQRDENIYRAIFESNPKPVANSKNAEYFSRLEHVDSRELVEQSVMKIDSLLVNFHHKNKEYNNIIQLVQNKKASLRNIPSIQPIYNSDLKHIPYGFGTRIDPLYKTPSQHKGMDFAAPTGTKIVATANGVVEEAVESSRIYGKYIKINHGNGYRTLYAHLSEIRVRVGSKVMRGDIIGDVGDTGKALCPHVHYEIIKDKKCINPIYFYFNDLSPEKFHKMLDLASMSGQSLD